MKNPVLFSKTSFFLKINYAFIQAGPMKSLIAEMSMPWSNWKCPPIVMGSELIPRMAAIVEFYLWEVP